MIKKSCMLNTSVVIIDYILHIMAESEKVMRGTKHKDDWCIYHDALTLIIATSTKVWMRQRGILRRWIQLLDDLLDTLPPELKKIQGQPLRQQPRVYALGCPAQPGPPLLSRLPLPGDKASV